MTIIAGFDGDATAPPHKSVPATRGASYLDGGLIFFLERCCCGFTLYLPEDNDAPDHLKLSEELKRRITSTAEVAGESLHRFMVYCAGVGRRST